MPVGWPDPDKTLTARERFISMGRIRPVDPEVQQAWKNWSAVRRNIWLWRTTNEVLLDTCRAWAERVDLLDFRDLVGASHDAVSAMLVATGIDVDVLAPQVIPSAIEAALSRQNERTGGYQLAASTEWSRGDVQSMHEAQQVIDIRMRECHV